jgi:hypothetical protein
MEDVAVYGYITPLKVKIVLALALSDSVVMDVEVIMVRPLFPVQHLVSLILFDRYAKPCIWRTIPQYQNHS